MNDATYPQTYRNAAGRCLVMRTEAMTDERKTMLSYTAPEHSFTVWMTDQEVDALARLLRECHDTSKPLFKEAA